MPTILKKLFIKENINNYKIYASYLENYNKELIDLLAINNNTDLNNKENYNPYNNHNNHNHNNRSYNKINLRILSSNHIEFENLTKTQIFNPEQALKLIQSGNQRRTKAHTTLNTVKYT